MTCNNPDHKCKGEIVTRGRYRECDQCGFRPPVPAATMPPVPAATMPPVPAATIQPVKTGSPKAEKTDSVS